MATSGDWRRGSVPSAAGQAPAHEDEARGQYDEQAVTVLPRLSTYLKRLLRFALVMVALIGVMAASLAVAGPQLRKLVSAHTSDHQQISLKPLAERSYIYDSLGNEQGVMTNSLDPQNRSQVSLDEIPETVKGSVLAVEDAAFYRHNGVNIRSIARAVDANLESGEVSQGGSTITQQVVKNSLVGDEQDISRKLQEAFLAVELEKQMSKDEILEYYLNSVYFGGGAYGVQAASEYYFAKDVGTLNWAEGALLAALIRSPNYYNPFRNPDVATARRTIVFKRLIATDKLTRDEVDFVEAVPLPTVPNKPIPPYDYFVEEVKQQLLANPKFGLGATTEARNRTVFEGGIKVFTTFDPGMQVKAVQARDETLPANKGDATFDVTDPKTGQATFGTAAITSIQPETGAVRVMVGGAGFDRYPFNLALSERQPGSTMKTYVMASLFEQGFVPEDSVSGGCTFKFPGETETITYQGRGGSITSVTQRSSNCGYMKLGQVAGLDKVIELANRVGVKSSLYDDDFDGNPTVIVPSLPLGTQEISPLEMASGYATFANDGVYNEPFLVERIEDRQGKVLYQHQAAPQQVVEVQTARLVTEVLAANVTGGTGERAQIAGGQVAAGKTGTTDESSDIWFVGYTPRLATAIWMGAVASNISLASNPELEGASGSRFPAATWGRYYSLLYEGQPTVEFKVPAPTRQGTSVGRVPNLLGYSGPTFNPNRPTGGGRINLPPAPTGPSPTLPSAPRPGGGASVPPGPAGPSTTLPPGPAGPSTTLPPGPAGPSTTLPAAPRAGGTASPGEP